MNYIKGFRFHPTDKELIELLWEKRVLDRDYIVQVGGSPVQVLTQLKDICEFEPGDLPGLSELESGDNAWYFFCSPRYKYRNSKRKNRVTKKGYWKPTGKPREILTTYDGNEIIGSRQTLVFYQRRVRDKMKNENKTPWVMYEFELTLNLPNLKSLTLCKLKKKYGKVEVSSVEEGQSSHGSPSNLENHRTNNATPQVQLNSNEPLTEPVAFTEYGEIQSQLTTNEQGNIECVDSLFVNNDELYSTQNYFVGENEGPKLSSDFQFYVADNDIPKNQDGFDKLISQQQTATNDSVETIITSLWGSTLVANDQTHTKQGRNQHNTSFAEPENEGSSLAFKNVVAEDSIPMVHSEFDEFLRKGMFMAELVPMPKAPKNSDGVQNHLFRTNEQNDEFWDLISFTTDEVEAYPEVFRSSQQNLAAKNEGLNFTYMNTVESPNNTCPVANGVF
ncbi:NAC domain-containing protein 79-like [Durio zibethinus]|uniref:NAC domain-containing protein 79-like n=1 Tax=Durio zibethinus TaxID=66656 RepID=A0A6P5ZY40_DURZI|nr:NAC domain-containing protein 79-like [Durio zibethinus]